MKGDNLISPVADETVKTPGGDRRLGPSTLIRDRERGEKKGFRGESDGLYSPTPLQDESTRDDAEAEYDFCSMSGNFIYRHHVEPRVKLYVPREESFPIPMNTRTHTSLDVMLEKQIDDYWNVDGERELIVRCMDRLHKIHFTERKAT